MKKILLYFSKVQIDKRKVVEFSRISKMIKEYSDELLMYEYFDLKSKSQHQKNNSFLIIGTTITLMVSGVILYSVYIKIIITSLFTTSAIYEWQEIEIFKMLILLSSIIFISVILVLLFIIQSNRKSSTDKLKYLLFIEREIKERKICTL